MNFLPPDGASLLLEGPNNIAEASRTLLLLLVGRSHPFEETLYWTQFVYTTDRTGSYVAPTSNVLAWYAFSGGEPLFQALWNHLLQCYPKAYALVLATDTLSPS